MSGLVVLRGTRDHPRNGLLVVYVPFGRGSRRGLFLFERTERVRFTRPLHARPRTKKGAGPAAVRAEQMEPGERVDRCRAEGVV